MGLRIIVKNLPKKISDEKFRSHFSKVGEITDAKLKFTKDGKFRQFGFVGFKSDDQAKQAIDFFNTYIDASKLVVELYQPLNEASKSRPWSKYSKDHKKPQLKKEMTKKAATKKDKKEDKMEKLCLWTSCRRICLHHVHVSRKALQAFNELDGTVYQGRMLHIIAAKSKTEAEEIDEKNFKQKKKTELKKKAHNSHNWNSLFINQNSVANLMASRYQVDKSDIYDVHSSGK
ncbi:putative RNA-binding 19, partial [Brachionus plicatilis]